MLEEHQYNNIVWGLAGEVAQEAIHIASERHEYYGLGELLDIIHNNSLVELYAQSDVLMTSKVGHLSILTHSPNRDVAYKDMLDEELCGLILDYGIDGLFEVKALLAFEADLIEAILDMLRYSKYNSDFRR